jgi:hypothetical protein
VSKAMIPEQCINSAVLYAKYPKQKIILHSIIGLIVKNLIFLNIKAETTLQNTPLRTERTLNFIKLPKILNGVPNVNSLSDPEYSMTVLNNIIQTASLVIPSPNTKLNNLG